MILKIDCETVRRELSNYVEDDISPALRMQIEAHFERCRGCVALYDGVRNILRLVGDEFVIELPAGFSQRLYKRILLSSVP